MRRESPGCFLTIAFAVLAVCSHAGAQSGDPPSAKKEGSFPVAGETPATPGEEAAIRQLLKPIVRDHLDPNVGAWNWEYAGNGGYLMRLKVDVTGDGRDEILLSSSLTAVQNYLTWTVYQVDDRGRLIPYEETFLALMGSIWPA